jgi:hypothetical protein
MPAGPPHRRSRRMKIGPFTYEPAGCGPQTFTVNSGF